MPENQLHTDLKSKIQSCILCKDHLPFRPKPIFSFSERSKIIIVGQAPGLKVHKSGIPWDDASGKRLREWLGVSNEKFYDVNFFGIIPMGFCYPGRGKSGDLPPRPECAEKWMKILFETLKNIEITLLIGQYAQKYFLRKTLKETLTQTVKNWQQYSPKYLVLPHPSPRNNIWLHKNPWFESKVLPEVQKRIQQVTNQG